ncbi:MAG: SAM-dependent methyltransferase, partial [Desulfuromonadales bacterium]|nr:SAM-dependent methyltransferase [Desulfuromonadales bacterium]
MKPLATVSEEVGKRLPGAGDEPLRLFHGRGQTIPGFEFLTIDWYPPIALVTLYEERDNAWLHRLRSHLT